MLSHAVAARPNKRTEFALERAGLAAPRIVMDVRPEVGDVCRRSPSLRGPGRSSSKYTSA